MAQAMWQLSNTERTAGLGAQGRLGKPGEEVLIRGEEEITSVIAVRKIAGRSNDDHLMAIINKSCCL